jgi:predicted Rossmann fold flavoprotein
MSNASTHKRMSEVLWDVVVIGGGPSGMMAAGTAASKGARVLLLEKNAILGKKLLITGGGRCNVTNAELDVKKFLSRFRDSGKYLSSPFSKWSVRDSLDFFHARNMPTKEEAEQRVFPLSNTAQSVWDTLVSFLSQNGVTVQSRAVVVKLHSKNDQVTGVELRGGRMIRGAAYILATGGTSHPETGSTGDGYGWLRSLGHTVIAARAALVPVALKDPIVKKAAGASVQNAKITLFQNGIMQTQHRGKVLFTHVGLSGPGILNVSREIGELLSYGPVDIEIDFLPDMGYEKVNAALQGILKEHANRKIRNSLKGLLVTTLSHLVLERAKVDPETLCNAITRVQRLAIQKELKHSRFEVSHLLGMDKAIITAGGVDLQEVDFKTMSSTKYKNLYFVGDVLNIDRPSGGYSLQLCWTTGAVAGQSAASATQRNTHQ